MATVTEKLNFQFHFIYFNNFKFKELHVGSGYYTGQHSLDSVKCCEIIKHSEVIR